MSNKGRGAAAARAGMLVACVVALVGLGYFFDLKALVREFLEWTRGLGMLAPVFVALFYIVACLFFLPGSILTIGAGALFGLFQGFIVVSVGSTLGAAAAFLAGRFLARDWVAAKVQGNAKFSAIDRAVERQGFKIVFLTRLSPVFPFNLLNYAYGLTGVRFWSYVLGSWLGMMPGTVVFVYIGVAAGTLARAAAGETEQGIAQQVMLGVGLVATLLVVVFVTKIARKALQEETEVLPVETKG